MFLKFVTIANFTFFKADLVKVYELHTLPLSFEWERYTRPAAEDSDIQSMLFLECSFFSECFLCNQGLGNKMKTRIAKNERFPKNAHQFIFGLVDQKLQITSANSVIGKRKPCFCPETMHSNNDCTSSSCSFNLWTK